MLNPQNINVLRFFPGPGQPGLGRPGAHLRHGVEVHQRPAAVHLMIEESIDEATQWVVFEPNDEPLWARVRQSVTSFLTTQWRIGALQGAHAGRGVLRELRPLDHDARTTSTTVG